MTAYKNGFLLEPDWPINVDETLLKHCSYIIGEHPFSNFWTFLSLCHVKLLKAVKISSYIQSVHCLSIATYGVSL